MAGIAFAIMVAQTLLGGYENEVQQAWGWFLANTMPTISVVVANVVGDARASASPDRKVDGFYCNVTLAVSAAYLVALYATLLGWPLASLDPLRVMNLSSLWLAPMQGVVASTISIFFRRAAVKTRTRRPSEASSS